MLVVSGAIRAQSSASADEASTRLDVVGVKLGMTPDEARGVLRSRKYPMHEFVSTLSYVDAATKQSVRLPNSAFVNALVQSGSFAKHDESDNLTVFFSPSPGRERVVAIAHYNSYSKGKEIRESDMKARLAEQYGELPESLSRPKTGFQFSHLWNLPVSEDKAGRNCNFNLTQRFAKAGWWNTNSAAPQNYALTNWDLLLSLIRNDCGPSIVEVNWSVKDPNVPPERRLVTEYAVSIVSLPVADEGLMAASQLAQELKDLAGRSLAHRASGDSDPDL